MKLAAVITTRNEADNIANCIRAFDGFRDRVEIIVVDNSSTDSTKKIAGELGAKVFDRGPERSAQRNFGWRHTSAEWVMVLDADMVLPSRTLAECLKTISRPDAADAYWIPEIRSGGGIRVKARNFERSFYNGTPIDALRLFRREVLAATGGYDENLIAGPEDWELDIRVLAAGARCEVFPLPLIHNEKALSLGRMLAKKAYYSRSMAAYQAKWRGHPALKRQFSLGYRYFGVFFGNGGWKRLLRHPVLTAVMYFERFLVGAVYLVNRNRSAKGAKK